jgi:hypothetical protein
MTTILLRHSGHRKADTQTMPFVFCENAILLSIDKIPPPPSYGGNITGRDLCYRGMFNGGFTLRKNAYGQGGGRNALPFVPMLTVAMPVMPWTNPQADAICI